MVPVVVLAVGGSCNLGDRPTTPSQAAAAEAGVSLNPRSITSADHARALECQPSDTKRRFFCTHDRSLLGQESSLLGTTYVVFPTAAGTCPESTEKELATLEPVLPGLNKAKLSFSEATSTQVDSMLLEKAIADKISVLAFIGAEMTSDSVASVELLRTTRRLQENEILSAELEAFAARHARACRIYVATAYAADYFTGRVFTQAKAAGGGGVYGLNVAGTYYASTEALHRGFQWAVNIVRVEIKDTDSKLPSVELEADLVEPERVDVKPDAVDDALP